MNVIPPIPDMVGDGKIATGPTIREVGLWDVLSASACPPRVSAPATFLVLGKPARKRRTRQLYDPHLDDLALDEIEKIRCA